MPLGNQHEARLDRTRATARRRSRHRRLAGLLAAAALPVLAVAGCARATSQAAAKGAPAGPPSATGTATSTPTAGQEKTGQEKKGSTVKTTGGEQLPIGVYAPDALSSWASVAEFGQAAGQDVKYVVAYLGPGEDFPEQFALEAAAHGAEPVLQLEPTMPMAQIAAGDDDGYLTGLADAIRDYGYPVIVSFGAEANGNWYQYGWTQTPVADYRAAWARVMRVMRDAANVTWMDTLNRDYEGAGPIADYVIPGVDLYGIDAYYVSAADTFATVVMPTLTEIRALTDKPVMISETGIGQLNSQVNSIPGLVSGAREQHLAAVIYFNSDQGTDNPYHQNWALTSAGLSALRDSLRG
jgi:hypothetical protein